MSEVTKSRHLAKAVTWRIIASLTTALIAWYFGLPPKGSRSSVRCRLDHQVYDVLLARTTVVQVHKIWSQE
jgi:hypothetical protein